MKRVLARDICGVILLLCDTIPKMGAAYAAPITADISSQAPLCRALSAGSFSATARRIYSLGQASETSPMLRPQLLGSAAIVEGMIFRPIWCQKAFVFALAWLFAQKTFLSAPNRRTHHHLHLKLLVLAVCYRDGSASVF